MLLLARRPVQRTAAPLRPNGRDPAWLIPATTRNHAAWGGQALQLVVPLPRPRARGSPEPRGVRPSSRGHEHLAGPGRGRDPRAAAWTATPRTSLPTETRLRPCGCRLADREAPHSAADLVIAAPQRTAWSDRRRRPGSRSDLSFSRPRNDVQVVAQAGVVDAKALLPRSVTQTLEERGRIDDIGKETPSRVFAGPSLRPRAGRSSTRRSPMAHPRRPTRRGRVGSRRSKVRRGMSMACIVRDDVQSPGAGGRGDEPGSSGTHDRHQIVAWTIATWDSVGPSDRRLLEADDLHMSFRRACEPRPGWQSSCTGGGASGLAPFDGDRPARSGSRRPMNFAARRSASSAAGPGARTGGSSNAPR